MDEGAFIAVVQHYEELYNTKHPEYCNQQRRDNIWEEIGKMFQKPDKICRERWSRIRDNYRKALNLRKTKSGQAATNMKPPKFFKELTFLVPYLFDEEIRHSSLDAASLTQENECEREDDNNEMDHPGKRPSSSISDNSIHTSARASTPVVTKRRKVNISSEQPTAASVLKDYLQSKNKSDNLPTQVSRDPLTNFFLTMAQTVSTFPLRDQVEIKGHLFNMVHSVEMRIATTLPDPSA